MHMKCVLSEESEESNPLCIHADEIPEAGQNIPHFLQSEILDNPLVIQEILPQSELLDTTPCIQEVETPNVSIKSTDSSSCFSDLSSSELDSGLESADNILRKIRIKNINRVMIGTLNINSLASKFDQLREVIGDHLDILTIQETKLDSSFPPGQFVIDGYSEPYRLDRDRNGGGVMIYVREDIPSKLLNKHNFTKPIEGLFIEINLRKTKLLFFGSYRSDNPVLGVATADYFDQICLALDTYSNYDKYLLAARF